MMKKYKSDAGIPIIPVVINHKQQMYAESFRLLHQYINVASFFTEMAYWEVACQTQKQMMFSEACNRSNEGYMATLKQKAQSATPLSKYQLQKETSKPYGSTDHAATANPADNEANTKTASKTRSKLYNFNKATAFQHPLLLSHSTMHNATNTTTSHS
jgi:hypothetical protein